MYLLYFYCDFKTIKGDYMNTLKGSQRYVSVYLLLIVRPLKHKRGYMKLVRQLRFLSLGAFHSPAVWSSQRKCTAVTVVILKQNSVWHHDLSTMMGIWIPYFSADSPARDALHYRRKYWIKTISVGLMWWPLCVMQIAKNSQKVITTTDASRRPN